MLQVIIFLSKWQVAGGSHVVTVVVAVAYLCVISDLGQPKQESLFFAYARLPNWTLPEEMIVC